MGPLRLVAAGLSLLAAAVLSLAGAPPGTALDSVRNPPLENSCSLDVTLVLDASGSVQGFGAVEQVRAAAREFLGSLSGTGSTARLTQFGSLAAELAPRTMVEPSTLQPGGVLDEALADYYNPRPAKPADVDLYQYRGGDPADPDSYLSVPSGADEFTNWDAGLERVIEPAADLVLFVTDGEPTAFDLDVTGDPFDAGPPPDVAVGTGFGLAEDVTMERAVDAANRVKATSRILAVGVGSGAAGQSTRERLAALAGPAVAINPGPGSMSSINDVDVAIVTSFDKLGQYLTDLVFGLCAPRLVVQTLGDGPEGPGYRPLPGQQVTATPVIAGGFSWVLPDSTPEPSKTGVTDAAGRIAFQWRPNGPGSSQVTVRMPVEGPYVAGRPAAPDYSCSIRDAAGGERIVSGDVDDSEALRVELDDIGRELATCLLYSTYDPRPQIALTVETPTNGVRGDLDPPAQITSTLRVTNPGNVPLAGIAISDDGCSAITPDPSLGSNPGDVSPADGLLNPAETWTYSCRRWITADTAPAGGQVIGSTTTVAGTGPDGTVVGARAPSTLRAFLPAVSVTASLSGAASPVESGTEVTLVYTVSNPGNSPLARLGVRSTFAGCESPAASGDHAGPLMPGESRDFSCATAVDSAVEGTARVTARPLDPLTGSAFPPPNPLVAATDSISVDVVAAPPPPRPPAPPPPASPVPEPPAAPPPPATSGQQPGIPSAAEPADVAQGLSAEPPPAPEVTPPPPPPAPGAPAQPALTLQVLGDSSVTIAEVRITGVVDDGSQLVYTAPQGYILTAVPPGCAISDDRTATCTLDGSEAGVYRFTLRASGEPISGSHQARLVGQEGGVLSDSAVPPMLMPRQVEAGSLVPIEALPLIAAALVAGVGIVSRSTGVARH